MEMVLGGWSNQHRPKRFGALDASRELERRRCLVINIGDTSLALHGRYILQHFSHRLECLGSQQLFVHP
jgi:hypothetical protein